MKTFKLPDGTEVKQVGNGDFIGLEVVYIQHPELGVIAVAEEKLGEAISEPSDGETYGWHDKTGWTIWTRANEATSHAGWYASECWWGTGCERPVSWDKVLEINDGKPGTRFVPDPAADAPELPYCDHDGHVHASLERETASKFPYVLHQVGSEWHRYYDPDHLGGLISALSALQRELRAAREAERGCKSCKDGTEIVRASAHQDDYKVVPCRQCQPEAHERVRKTEGWLGS